MASPQVASRSAPELSLTTLGRWTPVEKMLARCERARTEEHGSMQHFATLLQLGEVTLKLHTLAAVGVLERFDQGAPSQLSFDLSRASSGGAWVTALREASGRMQPPMVEGKDNQDWLVALRTWLTRRRGREDKEALALVTNPCSELSKSLAGDTSSPPSTTTPVDLMQLLVEIRNKTTGHHAYGPEFWPTHITTLERATSFLLEHSPLGHLSPAISIVRQGKPLVRILEGLEPANVIDLDLSSEAGVICLNPQKQVVTQLGSLLDFDPSSNLTYIANGSWRDSDSSAEFLCHSLEAAGPADGCKRIELPRFAIRPADLPESETKGEDQLVLDAGVVAHNLPPTPSDYVRRIDLEERLRGYLLDSKRRHLVNIRGSGGFGKTSMTLTLCRELVCDPSCPYDAVVWMSARDVDLTMRGAAPVARAQESLADVWSRYARLFGEPTLDGSEARAFFETSMREEPVLLILDNFETFDEQETAYAYLDDLVQPPAKIIVTSRHVFSGDYSLEVAGMAEAEGDQLLLRAARAAGVEPLMNERVRGRIFERCQGHPYAMKLVATNVTSEAGLTGVLNETLRKEELLDALFRRSIDDLRDNEDAIFLFLFVGQIAGGVSEVATHVITEPAQVDLDSAIRDLLRRSLLEINRNADSVRYDMPAMAREFAQRHLAGHLLQTEIETAARFLRRWPALIRGETVLAAEGIARDLRARTLNTAEQKLALDAMRVLAQFDAATWLPLARVERELGCPEAQWSESYKRVIESDPGRADVLFEWSEVSSDVDRQVELKVQAVGADHANVALASRVAGFLNFLYARERDRYQPVRWSALMGRVIDALESRFKELDGVALGRLAWLYIHAGRDEVEARRVVERGLAIDFESDDLRKLAKRLKIKF